MQNIQRIWQFGHGEVNLIVETHTHTAGCFNTPPVHLTTPATLVKALRRSVLQIKVELLYSSEPEVVEKQDFTKLNSRLIYLFIGLTRAYNMISMGLKLEI